MAGIPKAGRRQLATKPCYSGISKLLGKGKKEERKEPFNNHRETRDTWKLSVNKVLRIEEHSYYTCQRGAVSGPRRSLLPGWYHCL